MDNNVPQQAQSKDMDIFSDIARQVSKISNILRNQERSRMIKSNNNSIEQREKDLIIS